MTWQYTVGLSKNEINEEALQKSGFQYKKIVVEDALRETIPLCMGAVYKNPSSMREDAPNAFSCSSLISFIYTKAGIWMPSISIDKYIFGTQIKKEELKFGDLIFSNTGGGRIYYETIEYKKGTQVSEGIDHVGMYIGDNKVLHASKKFGGIVTHTMEEFEQLSKIIGFKRMANINEERFVVFIPDNKIELRNKENLIKEING